jgi:hypothetical protein
VTAEQSSSRHAVLARMAICLLVGAIMSCATFAAIGFAEKLTHTGLTEALAGMMRALGSFTVRQLLRLAGLSTALSVIACFPVYFSPTQTPAHAVFLIFYSGLAAVILGGYFSIEAWYWFCDRAFPPPALILALTGLASAYASQTVLRLQAAAATRRAD